MYGILEMGQRRLTTYQNIKTLSAFARLIVRQAMTEDGQTDMKAYLDGWVETLNECSDGENVYELSDVPSQASDNLVYSNAHFYNRSIPLTSEEKRELCTEIEMLFERHV